MLAMLGHADTTVVAMGAEALADIAVDCVFGEICANLARPPDLASGGTLEKNSTGTD